MEGEYIGIDFENNSVYLKASNGKMDSYRFDVSYKTASSNRTLTGAQTLLKDGKAKFTKGERIEYSYGFEDGRPFLKYIKSLDAPPSSSGRKGGYGKPNPAKDKQIIWQSQQKIAVDIVLNTSLELKASTRGELQDLMISEVIRITETLYADTCRRFNL